MSTTRDFSVVLRKRLADDPELEALVEDAALDSDIAVAIHNARKAAGMTQSTLAKMADTSQSAIARQENADYSGHTLETLKKIARALGKRVCVAFVDRRAKVPDDTIETIFWMSQDAEWGEDNW